MNELDMLILQLLKQDLNAYDYIHIENEMPEGELTDNGIVNMILNANKEREDMNKIEFTPILEKVSSAEAEKFINETMRFLYEQGPGFGEVSKELKVLRRLYKQVKLVVTVYKT